jgi:hypothetical protein
MHISQNNSKILFLIITIIFWESGFYCVEIDAIAAEPSHQDSKAGGEGLSFVVTTQNNLISVKAKDASLKAVIERIGREEGIAVYAHISENEKVTTEFHDLPLEAALRHLSGNYAYISDKTGEDVSSIFVYPKGNHEESNSNIRSSKNMRTERRVGSSEPFKFEFDPSMLLKD